jgi:hypothetical protein
VHSGGERIATHRCAERKHAIITQHEHHHGIPMSADRSGGKILVHLREVAPAVEARSLAAYESLAVGDAR